MPYIGNTAADRFVASKAASVYSGDGSTTAFTLEHAVGSDEDILVSVDGVIQEPSVAYAVSNGTTLTFTAAPSSNSGNNIFVYYLFRTVGTVDHPSTSSLQATDGTFSTDLTVDTTTLVVDSTNSRVGVGTASPSRDFQVDSTNNRVAKLHHTDGDYAFIVFEDNNTSDDGKVRVGAYGNDLLLFAGGSARVLVDSNGHVTMPAQPAFSAKLSASQTNIAVGSDITVQFNTEIFDQNSDYNNSTYTFTAPVTGRYQFNIVYYLENIDTATGYYYIYFDTSNRNYFNIMSPKFTDDTDYLSLTLSVLADMDAGDVAFCRIRQSHGTAQTDINGNSFFSGYLVA